MLRKVKYYIFLIPVFFAYFSNNLDAQNTSVVESAKYVTNIYFHMDKSNVDLSLMQNGRSVDELAALIDSIGVENIHSITISAYASPDGPYNRNVKLAYRRALSIKSMIETLRPEFRQILGTGEHDESWNKFTILVDKDTMMTSNQRTRLSNIIISDKHPDIKEAEIKRTDAYSHVRDYIYPRLRYTEVAIYYDARKLYEPIPEVKQPESRIAVCEIPETGLLQRPDLLQIPEWVNQRDEILYLRTNFLSPLTNFGVEYCINDTWSIGADYYFPWAFRNPNHKNCVQLLGGQIEGRYWIGDRYYHNRLEGQSIGVYLSGGYYDFGRNYTGNQGEFVSAGVDYLYSLPICNDKLHLEFTIGIGYLYSYVKPYEVLEDGGLAYKLGYTKNFHWFGPTKAGVSLVVPITTKRREGK